MHIPKVPQDDIKNVYSYWAYKKKVSKEYYKWTNSQTIFFEKNSKIIQDQLGGRKSSESQTFRNSLDDLKKTYNDNFKQKDGFLNKRIMESKILDELLKKRGIHVDDLNRAKIIV
jgi:hypothetical protein